MPANILLRSAQDKRSLDVLRPAHSLSVCVSVWFMVSLFQNAPNLKYVRNVYSDITEIHNEKYDRITSIACFEHVENLPEMAAACTRLLASGGKLYVSIPNEGCFLWKFSYTVTTGAEFKRRFGLDYAALMQYEHINTADEIEQILRYYFADVKMSLLGIGKTFSFYRYYECGKPRKRQ